VNALCLTAELALEILADQQKKSCSPNNCVKFHLRGEPNLREMTGNCREAGNLALGLLLETLGPACKARDEWN
jgi:hypothetical protein